MKQMLNRPLAALAAICSVVVLLLAARSQTFTHVTIDGRMVRMLLAGSGAATVVFENGYGPPLEIWGKVQPEVSRFAKTVSYDRAGFGLSDEGPLPRDGRRIATELHRALRLANVAPPYILVGHSLGGPYIRVYAGLYPEEVAGMVLVDPTPDEEGLENNDRPELRSLSDTFSQARASAIPTGIRVFLINAMGSPDVPFATRAIREARSARRSQISSDSLAYTQWLDGVPGGHLIVTEFSGHNVPVEHPELVVDTIRQVVEGVARGAAPH